MDKKLSQSKKSKQPFNKASVLKDLRQIRLLSFASDGKALLYSGGSVDPLTGKQIFSNWDLAANYAQSHNMRPVELTDGGKYLNIPDRFIQYSKRYNTREIAVLLWKLASQQYVQKIVGDVQTYVCCSSHFSTFRSVELPELLNNPMIGHINGRPRSDYQEHKDKVSNRLQRLGYSLEEATEYALDSTYKLVAKAELERDFARASSMGDRIISESATLRYEEMRKHVGRERLEKATSDYRSVVIEAENQLAEALQQNPILFRQLSNQASGLPKTHAPVRSSSSIKDKRNP